MIKEWHRSFNLQNQKSLIRLLVLLVSTNLLAQHVEPRRWSSISMSYDIGGESEVNNISNIDLRNNFFAVYLHLTKEIDKMRSPITSGLV